MVHCLPRASHRSVDLRHRCLEPIYSAHYQEADVWALLHAHFVEQSLHKELCNVDLQEISSMRDKREHTGRLPQDAIVRSLTPAVPIVSSSFATDDQCGFSSCLSAHCRLTHLLHHHFRVNTSLLLSTLRQDFVLLTPHHLFDRNLNTWTTDILATS